VGGRLISNTPRIVIGVNQKPPTSTTPGGAASFALAAQNEMQATG